MKKGLKLATASFLAVAAIAPITAAAAEQTTVADGVYVNGKYYTSAEFAALSATEKKALIKEGIKSKTFVFVLAGKVYDVANPKVLLADSNESFEAAAYTYEQYVEKTGNELSTTGGIVTKTEVTELKVESVSAINAAQVEVKFSKAVTKTTAEALANYTINGVALTGSDVVKLSEDGKTAVITLVTTLKPTNQSTVEIGIQNVKDVTTKTVAEFKGKVTFLDLTIPTVLNAKLISPSQVQVFFSEPVTGSDFLIDGGKYSATVSSSDAATNSVILQTGTLATGEHTVTINNNNNPSTSVKDFAGLMVAKAELKFTVSEDKTAPTITSIDAVSQNEVTVTFSEPVNGSTLVGNIYHTAETDNYRATSVTAVPGTNNTQFKVVFDATRPLPVGSVQIIVSKEKAVDNFNNKNTAILTGTTVIAADVTKPVVTEFKYVNASRVDVTFSEIVTGASLKSNYKVTDKDGKVVDFAVSPFNSTDKKVSITFPTALTEGQQYIVEIKDVKDTAVIPNTLDTYTNTFTVADVTGPTVLGNGIYNSTDKKITVFFSEKIDGTTALDKSKYTLVYPTGATTSQLALPSDATLTLGADNTSVTIQLPAIVKNAAGTDITSLISKVIVGQVKDIAGNTSNVFNEVGLAPLTSSLDGTNVVLSEQSKTTSTTTVQFELNQPLQNIVAADFEVNGVAVEYATFENKTLSNGTYGAVVTLKVPTANAWVTDVKPAVEVTAGANTTSVYGEKFTQTAFTLINANALEDGVAPAVAVAGTPAAAKVEVFDRDGSNNSIADTIEITFTEALKASTVSVDDFKVAGYEVTDIDPVTANKVTLKIKEASTVNITDTFVVTLVGNISDLADNVLVANPTKEYKTLPVSSATLKAALIATALPGATVAGSGNNYSVTLPASAANTPISTVLQATLTATVAENVTTPVTITGIGAGGANVTLQPSDITGVLTNGTVDTDKLNDLLAVNNVTVTTVAGLAGKTVTINGVNYNF